jgi:membrane protease subunit HflC
MMRGIAGILIVLVAIAAGLAYTALFYVHQTEQALVLRFGEPIRDPITKPGLQYKLPFVDTVIFIDKRILDLDNPVQEVIASDQKRLVVDAFARYRVTDPLRFYQSVGTIEGAQSRLATILNSSLRRVLGESTFIQVVRDERAALMNRIRDQVNREAQSFGLDVVDVRIRRADLPDANSQAIFQRMQTERQQEAAEFRARGAEQAQRTRARADRDVAVLLAEANSKSEQIRGDGDGERNRIFAEAFGRDPDFFNFYRSMQAYEAGLKQGETRLLLAPDSDFFRYFNDASGRAPGTASQEKPAGGAAR